MIPALIWRIEGTSVVSGSSGLGGFSSAVLPFNVTMFGMYGVNGNEAGYIQMFYGLGTISSNSTLGTATIQARTGFLVSSTDIVVANNAKFASGQLASSSINLNNARVLIYLSSSGQVESTANLTYYRSVYVNSSGALVWVQVNSTTQLIAVFSNNASGYVNSVNPVSVNNDTFSINETTHIAQRVVVNATGYALFNLTLNGSPANLTGITVYKSTTSGSIALSSQDYFLVNGKLEIFDDPSSTYYVVYPQTVSSGGLPFATIGIIIVVGMVVVAVVVVMMMRKRPKPTGPA